MKIRTGNSKEFLGLFMLAVFVVIDEEPYCDPKAQPWKWSIVRGLFDYAHIYCYTTYITHTLYIQY